MAEIPKVPGETPVVDVPEQLPSPVVEPEPPAPPDEVPPTNDEPDPEIDPGIQDEVDEP